MTNGKNLCIFEKKNMDAALFFSTPGFVYAFVYSKVLLLLRFILEIVLRKRIFIIPIVQVEKLTLKGKK